jgi:hypothetical protein
MRTGITFEVSATNRHRLKAIFSAGRSLLKRQWRAKIILMSEERQREG